MHPIHQDATFFKVVQQWLSYNMHQFSLKTDNYFGYVQGFKENQFILSLNIQNCQLVTEEFNQPHEIL